MADIIEEENGGSGSRNSKNDSIPEKSRNVMRGGSPTLN